MRGGVRVCGDRFAGDVATGEEGLLVRGKEMFLSYGRES